VKLDVLAGESHFLLHLVPVWNALPEDLQGTFFVRTPRLLQAARSLGLRDADCMIPFPRTGNAALVASWGDLRLIPDKVPTAYMEHGAGFTYLGNHPSYAGGRGHDNVTLFLCPNERVANINRREYPDAIIEVVGCPKLDHVKVRGVQGRTVAVSFHWPARVCPETSWAFPEYRNYLRSLSDLADVTVLGHGHPRIYKLLAKWYAKLGTIETVEDFNDVLDRADLYIVDTSSTMYEFAAAGRPVVTLNSAHYRRNVHHGLRFWEHIPGPQVDKGAELAATVRGMIDGDWESWEDARKDAVAAVFPVVGGAAERTVETMIRVLGLRSAAG
jgi:CDP-Glycerol:Poly(glycerophosphate) glycerophosphotransferase